MALRASRALGATSRPKCPAFAAPSLLPRRRGPAPCRVLTESADLAIGTIAPTFTLPEPLTGKKVSLSDFKGAPALLVMIICNHCPYVVLLKEEIVRIAKEYEAKGVAVVAISSNSVQTHPQVGTIRRGTVPHQMKS